MNKKLRKILVPLGTLATVATVATAVSCGGNTPTKLSDKPNGGADNQKVKEYTLTNDQYIKNDSQLFKSKSFVSQVNAKYTPTAYATDASGSSGSKVVNMDLDLSNDNFISPYIISNPSYNVTSTSQSLVQPGTWALKLGYASAIVLTVDGKDKVYDSDDYTETKTVSSKDVENGYAQFTSKESNSINNPQFLVDLKNATNMKLKIRKGMKWVNSNGNVVENSSNEPYTVTAQDFLAGWERTQAFNISSVLTKYGGTDEMNNVMIASNNAATINAFNGKNHVDNTYVYKLYGVDPTTFSDESKFITKENGDEYLNFSPLDGQKPDYTLLLQNISSSYDFVPVPYEWIQDQNKTLGDKVLTAITDSTLPEMKTAYNKLDKDSLAYKLGIYWYGYDQTKILSSGPYYEPEYDAASNSQSYKLNTHYWDTTYVNNPLTIKEFQQKYQGATIDDKAFNDSLFNGIKTGILSQANYGKLTNDQKTQVEKNSSQFNIAYNSVFITDKQTEYVFFNINPLNQSSDTKKYESDAYTKLMFGTTQDQVLNNSVVNPIKTATSAQALEFRTILESSIAWNQYVNQLRANYGIASIPWLSPYAFDVPVNGKDVTKSTTPRQNYYKLNNTFVVDSNGNKLKFDKVTPADYNGQGTELSVFATSNLGATTGNSLQSSVYSQLQTQMTKLLDDFYAKNPELNNQKMTVLIPTSFQYPTNFIEMLKSIAKTWNGLDTKNRLDFQVKLLGEKSNNKTFSNAIWNSTNPWAYNSWGYDYKEINSGFDGLQLYGFDYIYFNEIADPTYKAQLAKSFPVLASIGDYFKQYLNNNHIVLKIRTDLNYSQDATSFITTKENPYETVLQKLLSVPQSDIQTAESELFEDSNLSLGLVTSQFWKWMSNELTQQQMIDLMHETTMILTPFPAVLFRQNSFAITKGKATDTTQLQKTSEMPEGSVVFEPTVTPSLYLQGYSIPYSFDNEWGIGYSNNLRLLPTKQNKN